MSDAALSAAILAVTLALFVSERLRHDLVGLTALIAILVTWFAAQVSYPLALRLLTVLLGVGLAAFVGARVGSRLSRSFHALVRRDQAVAVRASHELRTPITALRLSLEDLTLWKQTPPDVRAELQRSIDFRAQWEPRLQHTSVNERCDALAVNRLDESLSFARRRLQA